MSPTRAPNSLAAIVLAAGESKRFRSATPKVAHDLCGRPLAAYVLDAIKAVKPSPTVVVTGRAADQVEAALKGPVFVRQEHLSGTADAARAGLAATGTAEHILVVPGDTPLLTSDTLKVVLKRHRAARATATLLTARLRNPSGYGRVLRDGDRVTGIVEHRDATKSQRAIDEINAGVYVFQREALERALDKVGTDNAQGERYLTDVIAILADAGERVEAVQTADPVETLGVNDRGELAVAAAIIRARTNDRLMEWGVTIVDPAQTYIDPSVKVKPDTVIHPLTFLHGKTVIGTGCEIGPSTRIRDSRIADRATVCFSEVIEATVGEGATVGPYAYLRPGARLAANSKVGTFVEVKNSTVGEGSKVPHLSYVGDATIGKGVNVGAATVTVNYDAETKTKSRTVIGDGVKIGSDTMLVAPVKVGKNAVTGAGSVVTKDVPADTVVVGNPAKKLRKRKGGSEA